MAESVSAVVPKSEGELMEFFGKKSCMKGHFGEEISVADAKDLFTAPAPDPTGGMDIGMMGMAMLQCNTDTELPPVTKVKAALELSGVTKDQAEQMKPAIKSGIAKTIEGVEADQVRILGFKDAGGRRLQDSGVKVDFEVVVPEGAAVTAEAVTSSVEAIADDTSALVENVKEAVAEDPTITVDTSALQAVIPEDSKPQAVVVEEVKMSPAPTPAPTAVPTAEEAPVDDTVESHAVAAAAALALLLRA